MREETSGFDPKELKALYQYMNFITKDYVWYYDTPEQRFRYTPNSIWLINPETKQWMLELQKNGWLWWYVGSYRNFQRYFNMEMSDYDKFIKIWVEDVLNRGVSSTRGHGHPDAGVVEDVLNRGVSSTEAFIEDFAGVVEDVLKNGKELK